MGKKNDKGRASAILSTPTPYYFNLDDVPYSQYVDKLKMLFTDVEYKAIVDKRNKIVNSVEHLRKGSSEALNAIKVVQQYDRKLADTLFAMIVQANLNSTTYEVVPFNTILRYYVDYTREDMVAKVKQLSVNLHKVSFVADLLESLLVDISGDMRDIFNGEIEYKQFDSVMAVLRQLKVFFETGRPHGEETEEGELFLEYSDSINKYLDKRITAYHKKRDKFSPQTVSFTKQELVDAMNEFFGTEGKFTDFFIQRTKSGGMMIDVMKLCAELSPSDTDKLDRLVGSCGKTYDAIDRYAYKVTDTILDSYRNKK